MTNAAELWAQALASWTIPAEILERAPESPWGFPPALFARSAERALAEHSPTPSRRRAAAAVPVGGSVLDIGVGAGAGSLPLAPPAGMLVGVDESPGMLAAFARAAEECNVPHREVEGRWPDVAAEVEMADVVVCHHVFYNVADLVPFATALSEHARRRVVVEMTAVHPQSTLNPLWKALHALERPSSPTAADAVAVLAEADLHVQTEEFERGPLWDHEHRAEVVAFARRRLCVGPERDPEIDALLGPPSQQAPQQMVTLWWEATT